MSIIRLEVFSKIRSNTKWMILKLKFKLIQCQNKVWSSIKKLHLFAVTFSWQQKSWRSIGKYYSWTFWELLLMYPYIITQHFIVCLPLELIERWYLLPLKEDSLDDRPFTRSTTVGQLIHMFSLGFCISLGFAVDLTLPILTIYVHENASIFCTTKWMSNWDSLFCMKQSQELRGKQLSFYIAKLYCKIYGVCIFEVFFTQPHLFLNSIPVNRIFSGILCIYVWVVVVDAINLQYAENRQPTVKVITLEIRVNISKDLS